MSVKPNSEISRKSYGADQRGQQQTHDNEVVARLVATKAADRTREWDALAQLTHCRSSGGEHHFNPAWTLVKVVLSEVPIAPTAATIASAIPPHRSAYSIAVAPDVSSTNIRM